MAMRSVVWVDRTFNLGLSYVTLSVYRNMSVHAKSSCDHPEFVGPVMFQFDGEIDTYLRFFRTVNDVLCGDLSCAETNGHVEVIFGSDEKAMVVAMRQAFPGSQHIFCAWHVEENVRRFVIDITGIPAPGREAVLARLQSITSTDPDSTADMETVCADMMEAVCTAATSASDPHRMMSYFEDKVMSKLRNIQVTYGSN